MGRDARRTSGLATTSPSTSSTPSVGRIVARLNWRKRGRARPVTEPLFDAEELIGIVPSDLRIPFDPRDVIARVVDGSEFDEFKALYGSLVTGWATLYGYPIGILANAAACCSARSRRRPPSSSSWPTAPTRHCCSCTTHRLHGRQAVRGRRDDQARLDDDQRRVEFDGAAHLAADRRLLRRGPLRHVRTAYDPRFLFAWPSAKSAVMGGAQLAGVLSIVSRAAAEARGQQVDEDADAALRAASRRRSRPSRCRCFCPGSLRRRHRPARHPHGAGNVPVRHRQWPDRGDVELRRLPDVSTMITRVWSPTAARSRAGCSPPAAGSGIGTVAVYTDPDAGSPHVAEADARVRLEGRNGYLDAATDRAARPRAPTPSIPAGDSSRRTPISPPRCSMRA